MISISRLLCGVAAPGDSLRYGEVDPSEQSISNLPPIVVWNSTKICNLKCIHCYANATQIPADGELSTSESKSFIEDLADFNVPVLLFSGGEPLLRGDVLELATYARELGVRPVLSTNGTLITDRRAKDIRNAGFGEVGISLDGIGDINDSFRGVDGAYALALQGIRNCVAAGLKVSLRFTITRDNCQDIPAIFDLLEKENIDRACFYHLAYVGRADGKRVHDVAPEQTKLIISQICDRTMDIYSRGLEKEILTVDNHADGVYVYSRVRRDQPERADEVLSLLRRNGGNNSGRRIGAVDELGNVHADQFWRHYSFGNVCERKFGDIWSDTSDPLMLGLKNRKALLKGRCARCNYLDICNGNLRVRAESVHGDVWAEDPACYLSDDEIGINKDVIQK